MSTMSLSLKGMEPYLNLKHQNSSGCGSAPQAGLKINNHKLGSYLAGLIEADGHFAIKGSKRTYIAFQFYLCQREVDKSGESFEPLFKKIGEYLLTKVILTKKNNFPQFTITTSNKISNYIIINYLKDLFEERHQ